MGEKLNPNINRREFFTGAAKAVTAISVFATLPKMGFVRKAEAKRDGFNKEDFGGMEEEQAERLEHFDRMYDQKEKAQVVTDETKEMFERGEDIQKKLEEVYTESFKYGVALREFTAKYPDGLQVFNDDDEKEEIESVKKRILEENLNLTQKQQILEELIKRINELGGAYDAPPKISDQFMRGFLCGYIENLCPVS